VKQIISIIILLLLPFVALAKKEIPVEWDTEILPGDVVCIYDIGVGDPLIDNKDPDSFKYWYRPRVGSQKSRYELRPGVTALQLRVLWPPPKKVIPKDGSGTRKFGDWWSLIGIVENGGEDYDEETPYKMVSKGDNDLVRKNGTLTVLNWQPILFKKAKFKVRRFKWSCKRKYKIK
jgi:hypothetical protein